MDTWICRKNIERLRELKAAAYDDEQRTLLGNLLEEEEAKLAQLLQRGETDDEALGN